MENKKDAKKSPLVSIGMAVYNAEEYIHTAINSLLKQTCFDYEIIISDDASKDNSQKICKNYAKEHKRIRYYRQNRNIGAIQNLNFVAQKANGKYFMWAGSDDYWEEDALLKLVTIMKRSEDIVIACSGTERVGKKGEHLFYYNINHPDTSLMPSKLERIRSVLRHSAPSAIEGLIRTSILRKTGYFRKGIVEDLFLLMELSIHGGISGTSQILFHKREGGLNATQYSSFLKELPIFWRTYICMGSLPLKRGQIGIVRFEWMKFSIRHFILRFVTWCLSAGNFDVQFSGRKLIRRRAS